MPGTGVSFWEFLQDTFENAEMARHQNTPSTEIDRRVLGRLSQLREAIQKIPFLPEFGETLERSFLDVFEAPFGNVPIFVRSDTNMEDLKEFTGAGLNLTVPNVLEREQVLQAIRNVWASPYTERSYRWRQKYLLNPENVYPSILLLRSVNVEKSGVLITTGVTSGNSADLTAAFNRGVGGAVEGQAAESYLLQAEGNDILLSPSREPVYTSLPPSGGVRKIHTTFEHSVLNWAERSALRRQAIEIRARLPGTPGIESNGPFDVELGFLDGEIWLFQVRPFVENRRARSSTYLQSLDPELPEDAEVNLKEELKP